MAENKNSFIIYTDWKQDFEFLTDEEAGKLIKHLLRFASDENPTLENEERLLQFAAQKMKALMKKDLRKYEEVCKKRSEAGKKGGLNSGLSRVSNKNEAKEANASKLKQNEHDNDNDNDNDNDILLEKESKYVDVVVGGISTSKNFFEKEQAKSLLKSKSISLDRWCMNSKLKKDQVLEKIEEFVDKKTDWEENDWKSEGDLVKNFEFWLQKNSKVVVNDYRYWTKHQFLEKVQEVAVNLKNKSEAQGFFDHYSMETEAGKMRFQNFDAWETKTKQSKALKSL